MTRSERRLLTLFSATAVTGCALVAAHVYLAKREALILERDRLATEWIEIEALFEDREIWNTRATWIEINQPEFVSTEEIAQDIYDEALASGATGVTTENISLLDSETTPDYTQAGVRLVARGSLASVFHWLNELNRPEEFRAIRNIRVTPDSDNEGEIVCQFDLLRWYTPRDDAP